MNQHSSFRAASLLERAAEIYDFRAMIGPREPEAARAAQPEPIQAEPVQQGQAQPEPLQSEFVQPEPARRERLQARAAGRFAAVDRDRLSSGPWILADAPVSGLAEEFRIVKRQLLLGITGKNGVDADKRQTVLVSSGQPDEGKTFCALNLALSLAAEKDVEVLLVDGDFAKPEILSILGVDEGPGLIDALLDPAADANASVIRTDIPGLALLPAGRRVNNVTELLASARTRDVLESLTRDHPRRIVLFDSPPALMASPASALAAHVGQVLLVVRADETNESSLRETVQLLSACEHVSLMLNGTAFAASRRRFGSYYGYGE